MRRRLLIASTNDKLKMCFLHPCPCCGFIYAIWRRWGIVQTLTRLQHPVFLHSGLGLVVWTQEDSSLAIRYLRYFCPLANAARPVLQQLLRSISACAATQLPHPPVRVRSRHRIAVSGARHTRPPLGMVCLCDILAVVGFLLHALFYTDASLTLLVCDSPLHTPVIILASHHPLSFVA
jgi:hypothetical protein